LRGTRYCEFATTRLAVREQLLRPSRNLS